MIVCGVMRLASLLLVVGCGGITAEHPLTIPLGLSRDQAIAKLEQHKYCAKPGLPAKQETYPRCERPGAEWGESWVTARYEGGVLVELKRYERFADEARALERWNQLVVDRSKVSAATDEADRALKQRPLEPGTRSVKAFRVDDGTIVGVYLLAPTPPHDANILEAVLQVPRR